MLEKKLTSDGAGEPRRLTEVNAGSAPTPADDASPRFSCVIYHDLRDASKHQYHVAKRTFGEQLKCLLGCGTVVEGFSGLKARLLSGEWPERYCIFTFDDGHKSLLYAAETLSAAGIRATFFLTKDDCLGRPDFLDESEIRELATMAHLGTHGVTHRALAKLDPETALRELVESKDWLEQVIGRPVTDMSPPGGSWSRRLQKLALGLGYDLIGTSNEWWNTAGDVRASRSVCRVAIRRHFSPGQFARICACSTAAYLQRYLRSRLLYIPNLIRFERAAARYRREALAERAGKQQPA